MNKPTLSNIPLEWVRAFEVAGRLGSFTKAAQETGLTQAAISQRISNLEHRIQTRLFDRNARAVHLTIEGEAWLPHISSALEAISQSSEELFGATHTKITISASLSIIQNWMIPRLGKIEAKSGLDLSFSSMLVNQDFINEDTAVHVRFGKGQEKGLLKAPLYKEILAPLASPSLMAAYPATPWQQWPRIGISGPRAGWTEWCVRFGDPLSPVPKMRFDTMMPGIAAAIEGHGVVLASIPLAEQALNLGLLMTISENRLESEETYWMMASPSKVRQKHWESLQKAFCR